jgi:hypothetical protein
MIKVYVVHEYYDYSTGSVTKCFDNEAAAEKFVCDEKKKDGGYGSLNYEIVELELESSNE